MIDYTKLRVEDIQKMIVDGGWMTQVEIYNSGIKGKSQWVDIHKKLSSPIESLKEIGEYYNEGVTDMAPDGDNVPFIFEAPEENPNNIMDKIGELPKTPGYSDVEWQDYVMEQFDEKELVPDRKNPNKKYPTINGLRRIVELLLGEIVASGPSDVRTTMDPDIPGKSVITYEISIAWKLGASQWGLNLNEVVDYPIKTFKGVGSSWHGNTDDMFAVFPEVIAENRAEVRALRRALRLSIVGADELTSKDTATITRHILEKTNEKATDGNWDGESSLITDNQINSIKIMCERLGIDSTKFINSGSKKYNDIVEISRQTAANMIKRLNAYQSSENGSVSIPKDILITKN
jgi:hypothetical protein